jgi:uncharacterized membrane protein
VESWSEEEEASIVSFWTLVRFVHVLSAMVWVGGQLLLSLLVLPVLRRRLDAASRAPLTREVGVRFGVFTVAVFLPVQIATGIALAAHRGVTVGDLAEPGYGRTLGEKVALFAVVLLISGGAWRGRGTRPGPAGPTAGHCDPPRFGRGRPPGHSPRPLSAGSPRTLES